MCNDRNCQYRIDHFAYVEATERKMKNLLSELGRANKKMFKLREELEKWRERSRSGLS